VAEIPGSAVEVPGAVLSRNLNKQAERQQFDAAADEFVLDGEPSRSTGQFLQDEMQRGKDAINQREAERQTAEQQAAPGADEFTVDPGPVQQSVDPDPAPVQPANISSAQSDTPSAQSNTPSAQSASQAQPNRERVVTPDGVTEVDTEFEVIDADQLRAAEGELQPRDRAGRVGSDEQVRNIAARLDPLRLTNSRESDRGAPIIDDGNTVLSGNGRTAAIIAAAQSNPEGYQAYLTTIEQMGYKTEGMKTPILVRRARGITPDQKRAFAVASNRRGGMDLSPAEQARVDKDNVTPDMISGFNSDVEGGVSAAANSAFVRAFMSRLTPEERNALQDARGNLTPAGERRMAAALFARAYDNKRLIERAVEEGQDPAITNALSGAAAAWARMRDALANSDKAKDFDLTEKLTGALDLVGQARAANMTFRNFIAQQDAFNQIDPDVIEVARMLYNKDGSRLAAWRDIRDRLIAYADEVANTQGQGDDMFGGGPASGMDIVRGGNAKRNGTDTTAAKPEPAVAAKTDPNALSAPAQPKPQQASAEPGGELFSGSEVLSKGPKRGKASVPAEPEGQSAMFDALDDMDADDVIPLGPKKDRNSLTPGMREVSFTSRRSHFEDAYRVAGMDPDTGILMPPDQQRNVLARVLRQTFGFMVDVTSSISTIEAQNQMLDAYRNVRFMMTALGLSQKAVSLNGTLTLALERFKGGYLGMYDPTTKTIHMPGRSNSFAHEWMHALDQFLLNNIKQNQMTDLLSRVTRAGGLDPTDSMSAAFINLIHTLTFDEADLAVQMLRLEQEAAAVIKRGPNAGQPTVAAKEAQKRLDRLRSGATKIKIKPTELRENSARFGQATGGNATAQYFASVHEMLARSFEAYVAHRVKAVGGTNEFITKGDDAYLSDADARLAMTFPKLDERMKIFAAFDQLMHHIRSQAILGTDPVKGVDDMIDRYDPQRYNREMIDAALSGSAKEDAKSHLARARNWMTNPKNMLRETVSTLAMRAGMGEGFFSKETPVALGRALHSAAQYILGAQRGLLKLAVARSRASGTADLLQFVVDKVVTDPGVNREIGDVFEHARDQKVMQYMNRLDAAYQSVRKAMTAGDKTKALMDFDMYLTSEQNDLLREELFGNPQKGTTPELRKLAADIRRIRTDVYMEAKKAGLDIGFIEDTGHLQRVVEARKVEEDPGGFDAAATKAYEVHFDVNLLPTMTSNNLITLANDVGSTLDAKRSGHRFAGKIKALKAANRAVKDARTDAEKKAAKAQFRQAFDDLATALKPDYARMAAEDWRTRIIAGDSFAFDSHGPGTGGFTQKRTLPKEADQIMKEFYDTDVLHLTSDYVRRMVARTEYQKIFGQSSGGEQDVRAVVARKQNAARVQRNPRRYDPKTPAGALNIIRELTDPTKDNLLEMALQAAGRMGAEQADIATVRSGVQSITGTAHAAVPYSGYAWGVSNFITMVTNLALLARAPFSSLAEPLAAVIRTGDAKLALKNLGRTLGEVARRTETVQQRAALARAIGLVTASLDDTVMQARVDGMGMTDSTSMHIVGTFHRATGLTQLTNAQRRAAMVTGYEWLTVLAAKYRHGTALRDGTAPKGKLDRLKALMGFDAELSGKVELEQARAEFLELGVPEAQLEDFVDMLIDNPDPPYNLADLDSAFEQIRSRAVYRFVGQVITDPKRGDKPAWANSPHGRVMFSLLSFVYGFTRNTYGRTYEMMKRDYSIYRDAGGSKAAAATLAASTNATRLGAGFAMIWAGQLLVSIVREALFSSEQWEEKEKKGELDDWLMGLATSRSGVFGAADPIINAITGIRYERDLTSLMAGPGVTLGLSAAQDMVKALGSERNSPNNNNTERQAAKSTYAITAAPFLNYAISSIPVSNPALWAARYGAMSYASSRSAGSDFADVVVGEDNRR
jgi:hypothetical protein